MPQLWDLYAFFGLEETNGNCAATTKLYKPCTTSISSEDTKARDELLRSLMERSTENIYDEEIKDIAKNSLCHVHRKSLVDTFSGQWQRIVGAAIALEHHAVEDHLEIWIQEEHRLKKENTHLQLKFEMMKSSHANLQKRVDSLTQRTAEDQVGLKNSLERIKSFSDEISKLEKEREKSLENLQQEKRVVTEMGVKLNQKSEQLRQLQDDYAKQTKRISRLIKQRKSKEHEHFALEGEVDSLEHIKTEQQTDLENLRNENQQLLLKEARLGQDLETKLGELDTAKRTASEAQANYDGVVEKLKNLEIEEAKHATELKDVMAQSKLEKDENWKLRNALHERDQKLVDMVGGFEKLMNAQASISAKSSTISPKPSTFKQLKKRFKSSSDASEMSQPLTSRAADIKTENTADRLEQPVELDGSA